MFRRPLTFPVLVPPTRPRWQGVTLLREFCEADPSPEPMVPSKPKILCVDDDETALQYAKALLGSRFDVSIANSGKAGLEMMASLRPDWVVVDYQMPVMDGAAFMRAARSSGLHADFILLTGLAAKSLDWDELGPLGLKGHLSKPLDPDRLAEIIGG